MKPCLLKIKETQLVRIAKKQYYVALLAKNKSDFKATCKIQNCATKSLKM